MRLCEIEDTFVAAFRWSSTRDKLGAVYQVHRSVREKFKAQSMRRSQRLAFSASPAPAWRHKISRSSDFV